MTSVSGKPLEVVIALTHEQATVWARSPSAHDELIRSCEELEQLALSNLGRATAVAERLVHVADLNGEPLPRARARRAGAQALAYANRFDEALSLLVQAADLAGVAGQPAEVARAKLTMLHALARLGRLDEAVAAGAAAHTLAQECGETLLAARADINLGVTHRMRDDPRAALVHFRRAKPRVLDQPMLLAQLESNTAEALLDLHDFEAAHAAFTSALSAFRQANAHRAAGIVEGNLADLEGRQGRLGAAVDHFENARRLLDQGQAPGDAARLAAEQAEVLAEIGMNTPAEEMLRSAIPVLEERKLTAEFSRASACHGRVLLRLGRVEEARQALDRAYGGFAALGHATGLARVQLARAQLWASCGESARAEGLLREAIAATRERPVDRAGARLQLSFLRLQAGDAAAAESEVEGALEVARALDLAPLLADALHMRARLHPGTSAARADLGASVTQLERLRGTLRPDPSRAAFLGERLRAYQDLASASLDANDLATAFETVERAKSRTLLDLLQGGLGAAGAGADAHLLADLGRERASLNSLYARAATDWNPSQSDLDHWRAEVARHESAVEVLERSLAGPTRFAPMFSQPSSLEHVRASLQPDEALVEYFPDDGALSAFVFTGQGERVFRRLTAMDTVVERVRSLYFQLARALPHVASGGPRLARLREDADRELEALDGLLLEPLRPVVRDASRLVVVPHGELHAVPFHALRSRGKYHVESTEFVEAPSASLFVHLRGRKNPPPQCAPVIVGVSDAAAPHAQAEALAVARVMPEAAILVGPEATMASVARLASGAPLLHIASHARFVRSDPLASGMLLGDGWLTARNILQVQLQGATVALSGCDSGRAAISSADELSGLVRSTLAAGASRVILSLWPLHDRTATEMMAALYASRYSGGVGPSSGFASALAESQRGALALAVHPVTWSSFVMLGLP
jgi:tetratricopeptide (TPR) repeat protein